MAIATPYLRPLTQAVIEYLEDAGVEVVDLVSLEVPDNLAVARLDPADLLEHYRKLDLSRADALVLSACVQMPSLPSIQPVQRPSESRSCPQRPATPCPKHAGPHTSST